jgi:hypothetical protein
MRQQNFAGAGLLLAQLLPQKLCKQNLRCASQIFRQASKFINPNVIIKMLLK